MSHTGFTALSRANMRIWWLLAFQAGAVNAGGFLACGRFVTHTTGFATHFGHEMARGYFAAALGMASVPFFFFLGAAITSYFVDLPVHRGEKSNFRVPAALVCLSLTLAGGLGELGAFGLFGELAIKRDFAFLVLLCLASGLQNALVTNAGGVVVRTTHLTGVTTDLAVALVRQLFLPPHSDRLERERLALQARIGLIGSFIAGAVVSSLLYLHIRYLGFLLPIFTSVLLFGYFQSRLKKMEVK